MTPQVTNPGTRGFYGWISMSGVLLSQFVGAGSFLLSFGVFLPVICAEFGWSRAAVSTGLTLGLLGFGLPSPLWGVLVARFGPRATLVLGSTLAALGLTGMSLIQEVWHIYVFYSLGGLGLGLGGMIACSTVANNWFVRKRSLAIASISASIGLGGFVFPLLIAVFISSIGWRMAWLVLAGIIFVVGSLIGSLILVRDRPEDMGQVPDGEPAGSYGGAEAADHPSGAGKEPVVWTAKLAMRQPTTWLIIAFAAILNFILLAMLGHQVAYIEGLGFSPVIAAMTVSLVSGMNILGSLGFGTLALRFNIRYLASVCFGIQLIALSILLTTNNIALIYVYAVLFGIGSGALTPVMPTLIGAYYGRSHYAQIMGVMFTLQVAVGATAPVITGAIYDATATYTPAFILITAFSLVGLICAFLARQPKLTQADGQQMLVP